MMPRPKCLPIHLLNTIVPVFLRSIVLLLIASGFAFSDDEIPLPEHPRPDFMRQDWINLNGSWNFRFDADNQGESENWPQKSEGYNKKITVPFSWGAPLSGVDDEAEIAWYQRQITVPESWKGKRIFLVVGACDWLTKGWLNGQFLGQHQGGYTPFEMELTDYVQFGKPQNLVLKVDDTPHDFKLYGKQGYGEAKGIWQTVYLEARDQNFFTTIHFMPDIDNQKVIVNLSLDQAVGSDARVKFEIKGDRDQTITSEQKLKKGQRDFTFSIDIPNPHLWNLDDPFLYDTKVTLEDKNGPSDQVSTYFGMRKISVTHLPGTDYPYVALNNKPIYLELTLDQAYHPEGFYTFPSDEFMRNEILHTKKIGLNGQRVHVKIAIPRKLYWADKLGVLIMADVPNSWGQPDDPMQQEMETAMRGMIHRDFNHPAVFSWILFNETWGLFTNKADGKREYTPETQQWVANMYHLAKSLDPTRLVEDNSACNYDHVITDMNTWHSYLPGYAWKDFLDDVVKNTYVGSGWNYIGDYKQDNEPMLNSECGNVWGYKGSTGDVDWSWDYHIMMNEFRMHPKIAGWLYTEHHDVINEWNGYYRFDRSQKFTGMEDLVKGMSLNDMHSKVYLSTGSELCRDAQPGEQVSVPLWLSVATDKYGNLPVTIQYSLYGWDKLGNEKHYDTGKMTTNMKPWMSGELSPLTIKMPGEAGLFVLSLQVVTPTGEVLHHNFTTFNISGESPSTLNSNGQTSKIITLNPAKFSNASWSRKQWDVLDGLKVNGAGAGYFEYEIPWPAGIDADNIEAATFRLEVSSKPLLGKDRDDQQEASGDYMRGKGLHDPAKNPNAYPMTDEYKNPSMVQLTINGKSAGEAYLPDDPADSRGILSWHAQPHDKQLREAGTYGYLTDFNITPETLKQAQAAGKIVLRLAVSDALPGGLAIYGAHFGRYPMDPTLIINMKD